jgi:hypothetical protein
MGCFTLVIVQTNRISCFSPQQQFFLSPSKTEKVGMFQHTKNIGFLSNEPLQNAIWNPHW